MPPERTMLLPPQQARYPDAGFAGGRAIDATELRPATASQRRSFNQAVSMRFAEFQKNLLADHERLLGHPEQDPVADDMSLACMPTMAGKKFSICTGTTCRSSSTQTGGPRIDEPLSSYPDNSLVVPKKPKLGTDPQEFGGGKPKKKESVFAFANSEAMREKIRTDKLSGKPAYNVFNNYHEKGFVQWLAKHPLFENITLAVIVINALWISVDTDGNKADTILDAKPMYIAADVLFFFYFTFELGTRFLAFKQKRNCLKDGWFVFDMALVVMYAFDPFTLGLMASMSGAGGLDLPTAVLRLFRLARLSRLVRMLRSLPELMIMIRGMVSAAASVGYTLALLLIITYVFSIAMRNLVPADSDEESIEALYFSSVPESMHNLIVFAVFCDNLADFILAIKEQSAACFCLTWLYIALASLTVMNMLIGVLCEVISAVAEAEKESLVIDQVNEQFGMIVNELDKDNDGTLSWEEFQSILGYREAIAALERVNVDPYSMIDMAEDLFFDDGEPVSLSFQQFMEMVLDLRGGQKSTVKDVMGLGKRVNEKFTKVREKIGVVDQKLNQLLSLMRSNPLFGDSSADFMQGSAEEIFDAPPPMQPQSRMT